MVILSIAFNFHDSNIALSVDEDIVGCLELERLYRSKKIGASVTLMEIGARFLLEQFGLTIEDVTYLVVGALNNPFDEMRSAEDIRSCRYEFLGRNLESFVVRHHLAHAGYFFFSGFEKALVASCDGGGDLGERVSYFCGERESLRRLDMSVEGHTSTKPYGQFSSFLYQEPFCEGKLMGLSGLCEPNRSEIGERISRVFPLLRDVDFASGQRILEREFDGWAGLAKQKPLACAALASSVQHEFVNRRVKEIESVFRQSFENLVLVGGSGLNLECNTKIFNTVSKAVYVPTSCDDTGIAAGQAAVIIAHLTGKRPRYELPFTGVVESEKDWELVWRKRRCTLIREDDPRKVADRLAKGQVCARHIGKSEAGPRALGHRSFLMSPCDFVNREILSVKIKGREWYRPLAPIVMEDEIDTYFEGGPATSPFMLFNYRATDQGAREAPAVVHHDGSSRVQTVSETQDACLYEVLEEFKRITGVGVLINTSLNLKGQPLSNTLHDTCEIVRKVQGVECFVCLQ